MHERFFYNRAGSSFPLSNFVRYYWATFSGPDGSREGDALLALLLTSSNLVTALAASESNAA